MRIIYFILLITYCGDILTSQLGCSIENSKNYSYNLFPDEYSLKESSCLKDETCCYYSAKFSPEKGDYRVSACVPVDYNSTSQKYDFSTWREHSQYFCNDLRILTQNKSAEYSITSCKCVPDLNKLSITFKVGILLFFFIIINIVI